VFFFLWLLYCPSFVFLSVAIILFVICFSFCGYYIVCHLFLFLWLLYCVICFSFSGYYIVCHSFFFLWLLYYQSFVFLSVAIILSVICFSFCGYYIVSFVFLYNSNRKKQMTDNIIATERKTNDGQYNSHKKKTK
jgi:hypothetical protein